jgi:hypothetical protein
MAAVTGRVEPQEARELQIGNGLEIVPIEDEDAAVVADGDPRTGHLDPFLGSRVLRLRSGLRPAVAAGTDGEQPERCQAGADRAHSCCLHSWCS